MKQEKIKVIFIDSNKKERGEKFKYIKIDNNLNEFYKRINCRAIDIPTRKIGNKYYDFIVDDEFLLKHQDGQELIPSVVLVDNFGKIKEIFFGNVIISLHDLEGNLTSLNDLEALKIMNSTTTIYDNYGNSYIVIKATY